MVRPSSLARSPGRLPVLESAAGFPERLPGTAHQGFRSLCRVHATGLSSFWPLRDSLWPTIYSRCRRTPVLFLGSFLISFGTSTSITNTLSAFSLDSQTRHHSTPSTRGKKSSLRRARNQFSTRSCVSRAGLALSIEGPRENKALFTLFCARLPFTATSQ